MNEVTRIHIAKIAYDIEVPAKKELQKYMSSLENYTADSDVLNDIEIRITELLAERNVVANGVVTKLDVAAIREQLGEPYEFADEDGDIAVGAVEERDDRKFFRSTDTAILGGVLSGIAAYFNVNPLWTRLVFILLTFVSFGFSFLVYILFWIAVPPARSATDKLRQSGRPVTLDSIRELNESQEGFKPSRVAPIVLRTITIILGIFSLMFAIGTLSALVVGIFGVNLGEVSEQLGLHGQDGVTVAALLVYIFVLLGLALLTSLFALLTYMFFAQKINKRMVIAGVVIIALGLSSAIAAGGIGATQSWRIANEAQAQVQTTKAALPDTFANVRTFEVENNLKNDTGMYASWPLIEYVVDQGQPRYELSALPGVKPTITVEGDRAKLSLKVPKDYRNAFVQPKLTIYGPALTTIDNSWTNTVYEGLTQDALEVVAGSGSSLVVRSGTVAQVRVNGAGSVDLAGVSITKLDVNAGQGLRVDAATINELTVNQPTVCAMTPANTSTITVADVTSGRMVYNGEDRAATSVRTNCADLIIDSEEDDAVMY